ncbi:hypothetical protein PV05_05897 [Exophiala xenobiotica]|uniref:Uncharacterized protein n=1 Tax=Exophiala xenobiotica TaxID=348802 RepID=A0A0D2D4P8_9EURO|nr:uncharacterized protein PV05_05897 [Exophiala xenobiotica]KIW57332.1 hypothetical protein PV05_05897 [Exophiala xenobiotica]
MSQVGKVQGNHLDMPLSGQHLESCTFKLHINTHAQNQNVWTTHPIPVSIPWRNAPDRAVTSSQQLLSTEMLAQAENTSRHYYPGGMLPDRAAWDQTGTIFLIPKLHFARWKSSMTGHLPPRNPSAALAVLMVTFLEICQQGPPFNSTQTHFSSEFTTQTSSTLISSFHHHRRPSVSFSIKRSSQTYWLDSPRPSRPSLTPKSPPSPMPLSQVTRSKGTPTGARPGQLSPRRPLLPMNANVGGVPRKLEQPTLAAFLDEGRRKKRAVDLPTKTPGSIDNPICLDDSDADIKQEEATDIVGPKEDIAANRPLTSPAVVKKEEPVQLVPVDDAADARGSRDLVGA